MSKIKTLHGHDPKNRLVTLSEESKGFVVKKQATSYNSGYVKKYNDALALYNHQISCSQN